MAQKINTTGMRLFFLLPVLIVLNQLSATDRTLTDTQGRSIDVELVAKTDNGVLVIRKADGVEFEIAHELLSQADREFLSQWKPPAPEIPENPVDAVVIMRSKGSSEKGYGSGFFAHSQGKTYVYTNQHVIADIMNIEAIDTHGNIVDLGRLEVSNMHDLARFHVRARSGLLITDSIKLGENVAALGNSEGAGVITREQGVVQGIGPTEVEVSAKFVPGNSGGPVINEQSEVVGVVTYLTIKDEKPDWVKKDTRYSEVRRFTLRTSRIDDWISVSRDDYARQRNDLDTARYKLDQAYWTFRMLDEGAGYLSSVPETWERSIVEILRNHNSRQKRPDATRTSYYVDNVYQGSTVESHADKKAASKRANLRALDRFLEDEFGDMYRLKEQLLEIGYFKENNIEGASRLQDTLNQLRSDIEKQIEFSKSSY